MSACRPRTCRIIPENGLQLLKTVSGPQRPVGIIFADDAMRGVFLGSLVLGDEHGAFQYGLDEQRDIVGYVERVGPKRWRLVMPKPVFEFPARRHGAGAIHRGNALMK